MCSQYPFGAHTQNKRGPHTYIVHLERILCKEQCKTRVDGWRVELRNPPACCGLLGCVLFLPISEVNRDLLALCSLKLSVADKGHGNNEGIGLTYPMIINKQALGLSDTLPNTLLGESGAASKHFFFLFAVSSHWEANFG